MADIIFGAIFIVSGALTLLFLHLAWKILFVSNERIVELSSLSGTVDSLKNGTGAPVELNMQPMQACGMAKDKNGKWVPQRRLSDEFVDYLFSR